ncbi:MAG TPA: hypothetical protein VF702_07300 [Allosphingosinicella sp.]|jgi:DhnA family fructose-bisphosphate aldolase class Ia
MADGIRTCEPGALLRWPRLFLSNEPLIVCPIDDALIFGPTAGLERIDRMTRMIAAGQPDAILTFAGHVARAPVDFVGVPVLVNCTASLVGRSHTQKVAVSSVGEALRVGAAGVAFHLNVGSRHEPAMLELAGSIVEEARAKGLATLGIIYPRSESNAGDDNYEALKADDPAAFAALVTRCVAIGAQLGCSAIKTKYTGSIETFRPACSVADDVAVLIAGDARKRESESIQMAIDAVRAGARGVSFGRNVFGRTDPAAFIRMLRAALGE